MKLTLETAQKQILSQQLMQSMELLAMSTTELAEFIEQTALENPTIEMPEPGGPVESDDHQADLQRKLDCLESTDRQNRVYYESDRDDADSENNWRDSRSIGESLADYLSSQLLLSDYEPRDRAILDYLIVSLDSKGYFSEDPAETAAIFHVTQEDILRMLREIWQLDPAGVGARNLSECLQLQLMRIPHSSLTEVLVRDYLEAIAKNHIQLIARELHVSPEEVSDACGEIRKLNPLPGNAFSDREHMRYITPDAVVVKLDGEFTILINDASVPKFQISTYYQQLLKETADAEAKQYLREKIAQAQNLANGISLRSSTLSKVMHVLVEKQYDFFLRGPGHKHPLRLIDIAAEVGMHESTISRTLRSKYLQCQWGIFPLNYFLTSVAAVSETSGESQTPEYIKLQIQEIVDHEDKKKPLSDEAICKQLKEVGVSISRRTVNKYRIEMGLPDKSGRKAWS